MSNVPSLVTSTGVEIPQLGFGTFKVSQDAQEIVESAISVGYRHLDTAQMYRNEPDVGRAWVASGLGRDQFFLTSKLNNNKHEPADARAAFAQTLVDLQTDYVDLFLIHWPLPMYYDGDFGRTWAVLEEFLDSGQARAIGLSNFQPDHVDKVLETARHKPTVNQVESHPYFANVSVHDYDDSHGMLTEAWSPLARGAVLDDPVLLGIAEAHNKTVSQVALRWGIQRGDIVFPKASTLSRQEENFNIFDFTLSEEEMQRIFALDKGEDGRSGSHPDKMDLI